MRDVSYIKKDIGLIFENVDATTVKTKKFRVRLISEGESGIMGSKIRCNALYFQNRRLSKEKFISRDSYLEQRSMAGESKNVCQILQTHSWKHMRRSVRMNKA